ncbi:acyl-CoA dehydrogenase [Desulfatibacillum alkenivorans DSM 16219]|jgi:acyl-CoA dehydrogenase|uniref:Acyl-CoA dehydrogenase n=1 Tax=Desulfatibacillum alkenivorans DSM 16219 TaxID=1121393 RepID=A0A1M6PIM4_9BACT|nr:acyl-CoA dehydrogenase family protein [Desulfatibacillum alkenivorans]SHK07781.1 acyl-CoA dehydrogenase [Desulfatibacillum alkenivorans DSM 16219]
MLNFSLSQEQEQVREQAREFALKEVAPVAWLYDSKDDTPVDLIKKAMEAGLSGGDIPAEYGGKGRSLLEGILAIEEIAAACPGIATSIFDSSLGLAPLLLSENDNLKKEVLPKITEENKLVCFGTSEPTMGSDVSSLRCRAEEDGDDYVLNGTKYWITNGGIADYMSVFATTDPDSAHKGVCAFFVDLDQKGVSRGARIPKIGQRCSDTVGIHFEDVRVPKKNMLAPPGKGFVLAMQTFSRTRPAIAAFAVGAARSAMEYALDFAKRRKAFGGKLAGFQSIQFKFAEMFQKVETSRLLAWKAAWEADQGLDPGISASIAKMYASEAAMEVVDQALQIFGGYGYTRLYPIEKLFRDTRLFRIYEGTSEVQRLVLGGHVLTNYQPVMPPLEDLPLHDASGEDYSPEAGVWRCRMCGHVHYGDEAPESCPYCFFPKSAFKKTDA